MGRPAFKLNDAVVLELTRLAATGMNCGGLAAAFNVTIPTVCRWADTHGINIQTRVGSPQLLTRNESICKEYNTGDAASVVAKRLNLTRNQVLGVWNRAGLVRNSGSHIPTIDSPLHGDFTDTRPPSLAMIRLAQHDPVIMRALRQRRGEPVELITPDLRWHKQLPLAKIRGGA